VPPTLGVRGDYTGVRGDQPETWLLARAYPQCLPSAAPIGNHLETACVAVTPAFSRDEQLLGFAFPKEECEALVASEPTKFEMPALSDLRYNWLVVRLGAIDDAEMRELVLDAWTMVVPKRVAAARLQT
jgi:hypothetical protein